MKLKQSNTQIRQEGWLSPMERASVSAISLRHNLATSGESHRVVVSPVLLVEAFGYRSYGQAFVAWLLIPAQSIGKTRPEITCYTSSVTLNFTHSLVFFRSLVS